MQDTNPSLIEPPFSGRTQSLALLVLILCILTIAKVFPWLASGRRANDSLEVWKEAKPFAVDLNHASVSELDLLPGLGESLATQIIALRDEIGSYETVDQITRIRGIKGLKFQELKPFLTVQSKPGQSKPGQSKPGQK